MEYNIYMPDIEESHELNTDPYEHLAVVEYLLEDATKRSESGNSGNSSSSNAAPDPFEKGDEKDEPPHQLPRKVDSEHTL